MSNDRHHKKPVHSARPPIPRTQARDHLPPRSARRKISERFFRNQNDSKNLSDLDQTNERRTDIYDEFWRDALIAFILFCLIIAVGPSYRHTRYRSFNSPVRTLLFFR